MLNRNSAPAKPLTPRQEAAGDAIGLTIGALIGAPAGFLLGMVISDHLPASPDRYPVAVYAPPAPGFSMDTMETVVPPTTVQPPATVPQGPPNSGYVSPR